jgi:hypothetical protein
MKSFACKKCSEMKKKRILVVEDEAILATDLADQIQDLGYEVIGIEDNADGAIHAAEKMRPDLVFMDICLKNSKGGKDGIYTATQIRQQFGIPIVFLSAYSDQETISRAKLAEPYSYLHKPWQPRDVRTALEVAIHKHQSEQEVIQREKQLHHTINALGGGVVTVDAAGKISAFNPAAESLTGWKKEEAIGQPVTLVLPFTQERSSSRSGENLPSPIDRETTLVTKDGQQIPVLQRISDLPTADQKIQRVISFWNLDKSEQSFQSLLRAQKLQSLGTLAAGMAHEFNNQLTPILGYTSLLKTMIAPDETTTEIFQSIEESIQRLSNLTRQMLNYAGKSRSEMIPIDINHLILNSQELLRITATKRVQYHQKLSPEIAPFLGNPQDLQQILFNLLTNSVEAIGDRGGEIVLSTQTVDLTQAELRSPYLNVLPPAGRYVHIQIKDNGPGILPQNLPQIFDPFFSTKFLGRGLGLAVVLAVVEHHKGSIKVSSLPDQQTIFDLYFPVTPSGHSS